MREIKFDRKIKDEIYEYHLPLVAEKLLDKTILDQFPDLTKLEGWVDFYKNSCFTWEAEENIYVYLSLILKILNGNKVCAIPCWDTADFLELVDKKYEIIDWQHSIEYQFDEGFKNIEFRDFGFIPAKTSIYLTENPKWEEKDKTALFEMEVIDDYIKLLSSIRYDVYGEINLVGFSDKQNYDSLLQLLRDKSRPRLSEVLDQVDLLIDLVIGEDEGFQDYLLIKSKTDISRQIEDVCQWAKMEWILYEKQIPYINTVKEFEDGLMSKLIAE